MHTDRAPLLDEAEPCDDEVTEADVRPAPVPSPPEAALVYGKNLGADAVQVGDGVATDSGCLHGTAGTGTSSEHVYPDAPSPSSRSLVQLIEAEGDRASPRSPAGDQRSRIWHLCSLSRYSPILLLITLLNLTVLFLLLLFWRQKLIEHLSKDVTTII